MDNMWNDVMPSVILPFETAVPEISDDAFVAKTAIVVGDVSLGKLSSIWFGCVVRGDLRPVRIGERSNIQDNVVIHVGGAPCLIGDSVTIGHGAILHGCTVGDGSLVGMGAIIMDGAVVSAGAMVAAGAVVTPGTVVKTGQLWAGNPAKLLRELTDRETTSLASHAEGYVALAQRHSASQT